MYACTERIFDNIYNKIFLKKILIEACSPHLYASFGIFCAKIGQLLEAQRVFEECLEIDKLLLSKENVIDSEILPND